MSCHQPHLLASGMESIQRAIDAIWSIESTGIIASLTRLTGDLALAEDLAHDALVQALEQWPTSGIPGNPAAWLTTAAKRRGIDQLRRRPMLERTHSQLASEFDARAADAVAELDAAIDDPVGDDRLGLMFMTCHSALSADARVALTLRLLGGLTTDEIARAYLVPEPTVAQRIVRAKRTLTAAKVPFEVPRGAALRERIGSVLEVIYLIFNEGYSATAGEHLTRPPLCEEALRLARILAGLAPDQSEVHGLAALLELQASRLRARIDANGQPILLLQQDRSRWDRLLIGRGLTSLQRAEALARDAAESLGAYALQASIAACHARAVTAEDTDWIRIASLYDALVDAVPSPVVALNRAVAISMAYGPAVALPLVDQLVADADAGSVLSGYHLLPSVRGDLLERMGRIDEARTEFAKAASMTRNEREQQVLLERASRQGAP